MMAGADHEALLFPRLTPAQLAWLRPHGEQIEVAAGDVVFQEGQSAAYLYVVLEGQVKVTRNFGGDEMTVTVHDPGEFSGELSLLTGGKHIASGRALGFCLLLRIDAATFRQLLATCKEMQAIVLPALAQRLQDADDLLRQREKMASLGKLSAGLAHELNNPAAAGHRAAEQLRQELNRQQRLAFRLKVSCATPEQHSRIAEFLCSAAERNASPDLDPMVRSDREDALAEWLEARTIADAWRLSATFVNAGIDGGQLEGLAAELPADLLGGALTWLDSTLTVQELLSSIENCTEQISSIVRAVKEYTHRDEAPLQEIDIHENLENTLAILSYKIRHANIEIVREYDRTLPSLCADGGELNQVWTNLLDNAADALQETDVSRQIHVRTVRENECVLVEIADNGAGILPELQQRIFEPFFTTKDVGKGTGLGLDIAYRIVVRRHHGDIRVESRPGDTRFQVRLPIDPPHKGSPERANEESTKDNSASGNRAIMQPLDTGMGGDKN